MAPHAMIAKTVWSAAVRLGRMGMVDLKGQQEQPDTRAASVAAQHEQQTCSRVPARCAETRAGRPSAQRHQRQTGARCPPASRREPRAEGLSPVGRGWLAASCHIRSSGGMHAESAHGVNTGSSAGRDYR